MKQILEREVEKQSNKPTFQRVKCCNDFNALGQMDVNLAINMMLSQRLMCVMESVESSKKLLILWPSGGWKIWGPHSIGTPHYKEFKNEDSTKIVCHAGKADASDKCVISGCVE